VSGVVVVPTGTANLASVLAALRRAGLDPALSRDPSAIAGARAVVLPGVGHFGPAVEGLRADGLDAPIVDRVRQERPLLAICLGLQVLAEGSDEAPAAAGLGAIPGRATRFEADVRCPHLGWAPVAPSPDARLLTEGFACFAHSYRLTTPPVGWAWARAEHGGPFVAAIERGAMLGCQLHPELSGAWGAALLRRWAACVEGV
jgi:imidazole glycerol-phosphate synthase subunit HisH